MAGTRAKKKVEDVDLADLPEWKRESVERSLRSARVRAQERTDRFVAVTLELMMERGTTDFTVQDVIDRSHMSIRTFYNFFASKDDLLVAVYETILADEVAPRLRKRCEAKKDPIERVRTYIDAMYEITTDVNPASRALTTYRNRLAETRPDDLDRAFKPQVDLLVELLEAAAAAGRLQTPLRIETAAHLMHQAILADVHARILGSHEALAVSAEELWQFCAMGIGVEPAKSARR
jgi:AcrR family transcriptional regulator